MKAACYRRYGPPEVVRIEEVAIPVPGDDEVLVRILATSVSSGDRRLRSLDVPRGFRLLTRLMMGLLAPRQPILGSEMAGVVEAVGSKVTRFSVGEEVFACPDKALGCHAQFRTMPEDGAILPKPRTLSMDEAGAVCFGGVTALHFLRELGRLAAGERLLVIGASGAVGSAAVQLARHFGAHVTGVCGTGNVELVASLGADRVIDYSREDVFAPGEGYDIILDTVGRTRYAQCKHVLRPGGRLLLLTADLPQMLAAALFGRRAGGRRVMAGMSTVNRQRMEEVGALCEAGAFRPVIGRTFALQEIVEAHRLADSGHKRGNVVVTVGHEDRQ